MHTKLSRAWMGAFLLMAAAGDGGGGGGGSAAPASDAPPAPPAPPAPAAAAKAPAGVKARVLTDCELGKCNDVVTMTSAAAKAAQEAGQVDLAPAAVEYAMTLPQNKPKPKPKD